MWLVREFPAVPFERYCGRCDPALQDTAASASGARRDRRAVGGGRSGAQSGQDAHRVLQGLEPHGSHEHEPFTSSATRFVPDEHEAEAASTSSVSPRPSRTMPRRRSVAGSSAGGCTCGAGSPSPTSHARSTRSCVAGSTTTDASTGRGWSRLSGASTSIWCAGPCGNTNGCASTPQGRGGSSRGSPTGARTVRPLAKGCAAQDWMTGAR